MCLRGRVLSPLVKRAAFDELKFDKASLITLPPTFNSIKGHLYRCFFIIQEQTSIFNKTGGHTNP